jgi:hypothetical protein
MNEDKEYVVRIGKTKKNLHWIRIDKDFIEN